MSGRDVVIGSALLPADAAVVLTRAQCAIAAAALEVAMRASNSRDGGGVPMPSLLELRVLLRNGARAASGTSGTLPGYVMPVSEITTRHAASLLGVTERAVRQLAHRGTLPARRVGHQWLIDEQAVRERARG